MPYRRILFLAIVAASVLAPELAAACGVSGPDGASLCALAGGGGPKWRVTAAGVYTATRLTFGDGIKGDNTRGGATVSLGYQTSPRVVLQTGIGALLGGTFDAPNGRHTFSPGFLATAGASWRVFGGPEVDETTGEAVDKNPFVVVSAALSFLSSTTTRGNERAVGYNAFDLRGGVVVGVTLAERFRPYLLGRTFGGPAFWRYEGVAKQGTDLYHVQVGGGASVALGKGWAIYAEGVPLGERGVSGGLSTSL
jgi:hypothetical protein